MMNALGQYQSQLVTCELPTEWGIFQLSSMTDFSRSAEHTALTMGDISNGAPVLTRIHSECLTGDSFYSQRCDCGAQLQSAMKKIAHEGRGAIIYMRQEGRGIGLANKIRAYALQEKGADTVEANRLLGFPDDPRCYDEAARFLTMLGVRSISLMTNNPEKLKALKSLGIEVVERIGLQVSGTRHNARYMQTKIEKMGHFPADNPSECSLPNNKGSLRFVLAAAG